MWVDKMPRKKTKRVNCWEDLVSWIESLNPYENTIVLSGWINKVDKDGTLKIDSLMFHRVSTDVLLDVHQNMYDPDRKKNETKKRKKQGSATPKQSSGKAKRKA